MSAESLQPEVEAARQYERLFVPAEFRDWAPRLADAAGISAGKRVLDVACGTGVVSREAAARTGAGGSVTGLDLNPGMLAVAAEMAPAVEWRQGRAESLPFPDGAFDAVTCQFGLMFFSDRRQALREMRRVLAPRGRLAVAVWDSLEHTPAYAIFVAVLDGVDPRAGNALRSPFSLGDRDEVAALFASAGMPDARIETQSGTATFPDLRTMVDAEVNGWLPVAGVTLSAEQRAAVWAEAEPALSRFVQADGRVRFDSPAHIVTVAA